MIQERERWLKLDRRRGGRRWGEGFRAAQARGVKGRRQNHLGTVLVIDRTTWADIRKYGKRALRTLEPGRIQCDTHAPGLQGGIMMHARGRRAL